MPNIIFMATPEKHSAPTITVQARLLFRDNRQAFPAVTARMGRALYGFKLHFVTPAECLDSIQREPGYGGYLLISEALSLQGSNSFHFFSCHADHLSKQPFSLYGDLRAGLSGCFLKKV
jgi:hypothetical protein